MPFIKIIIILLFCPLLYGKTLVKVGAYVFQPYFIEGSEFQFEGATVDLVAALNLIQDDYEFVIVKITSSSRYVTFERKRFDMMLFESQSWGWKDYSANSSEILVESCEKFVTKRTDTADQNSFENLTTKKLVAVKGYHYGFINLETDTAKLEKLFSILFVRDNFAALKMLLVGRAEVGVVAAPYLEYFKMIKPEYKDSFLVSDKIDQTYKLSALINDGSELKVETLNQYLSHLRQNSALRAIINKWHLSCP